MNLLQSGPRRVQSAEGEARGGPNTRRCQQTSSPCREIEPHPEQGPDRLLESRRPCTTHREMWTLATPSPEGFQALKVKRAEVSIPAVASRRRVPVASLSRVSSEALGQLQPSEKVLAHHTEIGALLGLAETRRSPRVVGVYTAAVVPRGGHRCRPPVRRKARVRGNPRFLVPQRNLPFATFDADVVKRLPYRFASIRAFGPGPRGIRFPSRASVPFRPRFALDLCASRSDDDSLDIHTGDAPGVTTRRVAMPPARHGRPRPSSPRGALLGVMAPGLAVRRSPSRHPRRRSTEAVSHIGSRATSYAVQTKASRGSTDVAISRVFGTPCHRCVRRRPGVTTRTSGRSLDADAPPPTGGP